MSIVINNYKNFLKNNMGLLLITITSIFIVWAIWYILTMWKVYHSHLKYLFEPQVNKMAQYDVGARYDAIHLKKDFLKIVACGVFLVPLRGVFVLCMFIVLNVWTWMMMSLFGSKFISILYFSDFGSKFLEC
jgi:hypothetical protein